MPVFLCISAFVALGRIEGAPRASIMSSIIQLAMQPVMGLMQGAQIPCQQTFVALGDAKVSTFIALLRKVLLLIPLLYILPHFFSDKVFAIFLAESVADFISVTVTVILFRHRYRKLGT